MAITPLPPAPLPSDTPTQFNEKAFDLVAALDTFVTETNALAVAVDADATAADADASTASTQAGIATNQAGIATTKAGEAASSAAAALTSANNAAASYDSFDDRYLGAKGSDPSVDNDGGALLTGALYWNTGANQMRVWSGSAWEVSYLPASSYLTDSDIGVSVQPYDADIATVAASQAEMEAGTETALRSMSPSSVAQAIAALASGGGAGGATVTASMSSNVVLTNESTKLQVFTPTAFGRTVTLPNATTMNDAGGPVFVLRNTNSNWPIAIKDSSGANIGWVASDYDSEIYLNSIASATGNWVVRTSDQSANCGMFPYGEQSYHNNTSHWRQIGKTMSLQLNNDIAICSSFFNSSYPALVVFKTTPGGSFLITTTTSGYDNSFSNSYSCHDMCAIDSNRIALINYTSSGHAKSQITTFSATNTGTSITNGIQTTVKTNPDVSAAYCIKLLSSTKVIATVGSNSNVWVIVGTISGTGASSTITWGTAVDTGISYSGTTATISVLSETLVQVNGQDKCASVSISGTTCTVRGTATFNACWVMSLVKINSTSSMVFYTDFGTKNDSSLYCSVLTETGSNPTISNTVELGISANQYGTSFIGVADNKAIVLSGYDPSNFYHGENSKQKINYVSTISGIPTVIATGSMPFGRKNMNVEVKNGLAVIPVCGLVDGSYEYLGINRYAVLGA